MTNQGDILSNQIAAPVAAFSDYPSALKYAETIFVQQLGDDSTAKDLVTMVTLTTAAAPTVTI